MNEQHNDIELIDRFLQDRLSNKEEQDYRERLQRDEGFKKLHEEQKLVKEGIIYMKRQELKTQLNAIENEIEQQETASSWTYYRSIAAGILLLLTGVAVFYLYLSYNNSSGLYENYFNPPETIDKVRSRGVDNSGAAIEAYNNGNFEKAEQEFKKTIDRQFDYRLIYYQGITKMRLGKFDDAELLFNQILEGNNNYLANTRWFLALTYIKLDREDEAIPLLQKITSSDSQYKNEALNLLRELKA